MNKKQRKIIFEHRFSPGDILTFTRTLSDLKKAYPDYLVDMRSPCPAIFENNPHLMPLDDNDPDVERINVQYSEINECGWRQEHWTNAYRHDIEKKLKIKIQKTQILPELYVSDLEKSWIPQVQPKFWIINAGRKPDNELKQYHRWQEVVDLLNYYFDGRVKIAQVGQKDHIHPPLSGVINLIGKTDLREYIRLAYWSEGLIGPLSFQFVIAAALVKPGVCVAGGKEDVRWHLYPHIRHLYTNGTMECCKWGGCWLGGDKGKCPNLYQGVPKCFTLIKPYHIFEAVKSYYDGGMLSM